MEANAEGGSFLLLVFSSASAKALSRISDLPAKGKGRGRGWERGSEGK